MIKTLSNGRVRHCLSFGNRGKLVQHIAECEPSRTLLAIGQAVFEFEAVTKSAKQRSLEIEVPQSVLSNEQASRLRNVLQDLFAFVLLQEVSVHFVGSKNWQQTSAEGLSEKSDAIVLFSGGVDSISGTLLASSVVPSVHGVFCAHAHQSRVIALTRRLGETYLRRHKIKLIEIPAPNMDVAGYSQTRGLYYVLSAAAVASVVDAKSTIVSECGPTMYQPKFGPADQVTMTTHPYVMEKTKEIIYLTGSATSITLPFEDLTKAEVMAVCPKPKAFTKSHSCISQRLQLHDGTCYGCVVRRLGAIASRSPDVEYANDPITDESATSGNLLSLLSFCSEFLSNPGQMPSYELELIDGYGKHHLFKRFALDNFAALYQLKRSGVQLAPAVDQIFRYTTKVIGGVRPLQARLRQLKAMREKPPKINFF